MLKTIGRVFLNIENWTITGDDLVIHRRCIVIAAPHTSNWDFFFTIAGFDALKLPLRFTIKHTWMTPPFNRLLGPLGAIAIDRRPRKDGEKRKSMVDAMAKLFDETDGDLAIVITPEGTRSPSKQWKTGFYHVAMKANVPILCGYLDYDKREAGVGLVIHPTGDIEADMQKIMDFYATVAPKHPENFVTDERYR